MVKTWAFSFGTTCKTLCLLYFKHKADTKFSFQRLKQTTKQTTKGTVSHSFLLRFNFRLFSEPGGYGSKIPLGGAIDQEIHEPLLLQKAQDPVSGLSHVGQKNTANDLCFPQILCDGTILDISNLKIFCNNVWNFHVTMITWDAQTVLGQQIWVAVYYIHCVVVPIRLVIPVISKAVGAGRQSLEINRIINKAAHCCGQLGPQLQVSEDSIETLTEFRTCSPLTGHIGCLSACVLSHSMP